MYQDDPHKFGEDNNDDEEVDESSKSWNDSSTRLSDLYPSFDIDIHARAEEIKHLSTQPYGLETKRTRRIITKSMSPHLPKSLVVQLFTSFSKKRPTKDAIDYVNELSDLYLKQVAQDLVAYAIHAKRKTIEVDDVLCLFRRQKLANNQRALEDMIRHHLPLENAEDILPIARAYNLVVPSNKR
jgi:histone H3/H4